MRGKRRLIVKQTKVSLGGIGPFSGGNAAAVPDFLEAVFGRFGLADDAVGGDGEPWVVFVSAGFHGLEGPDVADAREEVAVAGFEEDAISPAGWAGDDGSAVLIVA